MSDSASQLWDAYLASGSPEASAAVGATFSAWQFGYGVEQGDRLLACVLDGPKRATAGAMWAYEAEDEAIPEPGDHSVILDGHGVARCIIRTTHVDVVPFDQVDAAFAYDEGEGDRSLEYWRDVHWTYFTRELAELGREATRDMPVVCERFEVVYRAVDEPPSPNDTAVSRTDNAASLFLERNSCSQAVVRAFAPSVGLDQVEAMRLASGFGGGMRIGGPCGAATGAVLILGLALDGDDDPEGRKRVMAAVESFYEAFGDRIGATDCPTILGCDPRTPEGRAHMDEHGLREKRCLPAVRAAAQILEQIMEQADDERRGDSASGITHTGHRSGEDSCDDEGVR